MFCTKCGTQLPNEAMFCSQCGEQILINQPAIVVNQQEGVQITSTEETATIREYLKHAKTLEVNRHTLSRTMKYIQVEIDVLGKSQKIKPPTSEKGDFATAFWGSAFTISMASLFIGALYSRIINDHNIFGPFFIIGGIFLPIPIALVIGIISYCSKNRKRERQYQEELAKDKKRVEKEKKQIIALQAQQRDLQKEIQKTDGLLKKLYGLNMLYPKYREMLPVITMWEYIESGRCSGLVGPNGAYNLYESESRQDIIISNLNQALLMLEQIRDNQYALYEAIQESNAIAERVCEYNERLLSVNKSIEKNAALTAYSAKIASENSTISAYIDYCNM